MKNGMDEIYEELGIPYYFAPNFAHLEKYEPSFYLKRLPKEKNYTQMNIKCFFGKKEN